MWISRGMMSASVKLSPSLSLGRVTKLKLRAFQSYYNDYRVHTALAGRPSERTLGAGGAQASLHSYRWQSHCRGLYQTPLAA
jgi:hypothetical protein